MLAALEGPDRAGKSSVFEALRFKLPTATFVRGLPDAAALLGVMQHVERWQEQLWRDLYDGDTLYILDRSFCVTPEVYARMYARQLMFDPIPWRRKHYVFPILPPAHVLRGRGPDPAFDAARYEECLSAYGRVLLQYPRVHHLDWALTPDQMADRVIAELKRHSLV